MEMVRKGGVKSISTSPRPGTSTVTLGEPTILFAMPDWTTLYEKARS